MQNLMYFHIFFLEFISTQYEKATATLVTNSKANLLAFCKHFEATYLFSSKFSDYPLALAYRWILLVFFTPCQH